MEIWKKGYHPDLIYVSSNILDMCEKSVLDSIPYTAVPYLCYCKPGYCARRRCTLKKTNRDGDSTEFEAAIEDVNVTQKITERSYYMWCPEDTFQVDVNQITYIVSRRSIIVSMKHTRNSIQATLLTKVHWRLEQS